MPSKREKRWETEIKRKFCAARDICLSFKEEVWLMCEGK
jgi:hypothetical protein